MENGTFDQIVTHLEMNLERNGLQALDELQMNTVSQHATNTNTDRPKPTRHLCRKPGQKRIQCRLLKRQREQIENTQIIVELKKGRQTTTSTKITTKPTAKTVTDRAER